MNDNKLMIDDNLDRKIFLTMQSKGSNIIRNISFVFIFKMKL